MEFVPHIGTRAEFMDENQVQFERWMPQINDDRERKFMTYAQADHLASPEQMANPYHDVEGGLFNSNRDQAHLLGHLCLP